MYGAIIGDIVGSKYEFNNIKTKEFPFVSKGCEFTDDSIMTIAVGRALLKSQEENVPFNQILVEEMQQLGRKYPSSYGGMFAHWLRAKNPKPYNSFGNGSAMRVSPCGLIAVTLEEALELAKASSEVTHNHPEGIKGAQATAAAIFLARTGKNKEEIRGYIQSHYYNLMQTLDQIRPTYFFNETCQQTVPQAIIAFLESTSYEDAIRNAISIGGDSDTVAAISGAIAWAYYRLHDQSSKTGLKEGRPWPESFQKIIEENGIDQMLPKSFVQTIERFDQISAQRMRDYQKTNICKPFLLE